MYQNFKVTPGFVVQKFSDVQERILREMVFQSFMVMVKKMTFACTCEVLCTLIFFMESGDWSNSSEFGDALAPENNAEF